MVRLVWASLFAAFLVATYSHPVAGQFDASVLEIIQQPAQAAPNPVLPAEPDLSPERLTELRGKGPDGLAVLLKERDSLAGFIMAARLTGEQSNALSERLAKLDAAIDQVGGQRDCSASRLYWYTDLDAAKKVAAELRRPILSLRMLGNLTDEYSCANSRFFRTALYANEEVSEVLRDKFVLHWQSVRPVPTVTIDFGDGRVLRRTITGNSAHYLFSFEIGIPIDALPGLYGPKAFLEWLNQGENLVQTMAIKKITSVEEYLGNYHRRRAQEVDEQWQADLKQVAEDESVVPADAAGLEAAMTDPLWDQIAALHAADAKLDRSSVTLIRRENPTAAQAGRLAMSKAYVEDPVLRLVRNFESTIALDTVRNEYLLHRRIHEWYAAGTAPSELDSLNARVYGELFLMPLDDPWLGLAPIDTYSALDNNGVVRAEKESL